MAKNNSFTDFSNGKSKNDATNGYYSVLPRFFVNLSYAKNMSFKDYRETYKISNLVAFFMVFKSCVGLGVFSYPYAFGKCGYVYGTILCIVSTYMTGYGMYSLSNLAATIEKTKFGLKKMHNYNSRRLFLRFVDKINRFF